MGNAPTYGDRFDVVKIPESGKLIVVDGDNHIIGHVQICGWQVFLADGKTSAVLENKNQVKEFLLRKCKTVKGVSPGGR